MSIDQCIEIFFVIVLVLTAIAISVFEIYQAHRADKIFQETVQLNIKTVNEIMEMNKKQIERVEEEVLSMQEMSDDNAN